MYQMSRVRLAAWLALFPFLLIRQSADAAPSNLTVMTQNLYIGANTNPILKAPDIATASARAAAAFNAALANNPSARAKAIANEVAGAGGPLLIGLQEAGIISGGGVTINYTQALLEELASRGLDYTIAGVHTGASVSLGGFSATDRDAVLARVGIPGFTVTGTESRTFTNNVALPTVLGPVSLNRGYVLVDAQLNDVPFQLVSTHLDEFQTPLQPLQANQILAELGASTEPQLVVGDFNAAPGTSTYQVMTAAGFLDIAALAGALGNTCCQAPDLNNPVSQLTRRYDYVFGRNFPSIGTAFLVGDTPFENVQPFWPSDHAGVVAIFAVPEPSSGAVLVGPMVLLLGILRLRRRPTPAHPVREVG